MLSLIATQLSGWLQNYKAVNQLSIVGNDTMTSKSFLLDAITHLIKEVESVKELVAGNAGKIMRSYDQNSCNFEDDDPFLTSMHEEGGPLQMKFHSEWIDGHFDPPSLDVKAEKKIRVSSLSLSNNDGSPNYSSDFISDVSIDEFMSHATSAPTSINQGSDQPMTSLTNKPLSAFKYNPMQKYRRARLEEFLKWYRGAKQLK